MSTAEKEALESLDAYGHIQWGVGWTDENNDDENSDRGDWLACCDYAVFTDEEGVVKIAYHVVVGSDSGGFVETPETRVVTADKAPFNLPACWMDIGLEQVVWTEAEFQEGTRINAEWNQDLARALGVPVP